MKPTVQLFVFLCLFFKFSSCQQHAATTNASIQPTEPAIAPTNADSIKTIHVMVALCDNKYQGIVPVPAGIGNGQNPYGNLYWGAGYGVKTYFLKSREWKLMDKITVAPNAFQDSLILERLLFKHHQKPIYLLAEAYNGKSIKQTTIDFLQAASGANEVSWKLPNGKQIYFAGQSNLVAYIGHDGLMDFSIGELPLGDSTQKRETIILACYSKHFFSPFIKNAGARPLLWSTGLMAPEAYVLHDALSEWCAGKSAEDVRKAAANAYARYQRCSIKSAERLLVTGY